MTNILFVKHFSLRPVWFIKKDLKVFSMFPIQLKYFNRFIKIQFQTCKRQEKFERNMTAIKSVGTTLFTY